ncbi:hypothetical protein [Ottowia sp. oral taxon 894]|uniref:hypothetical protein n=1 Tax=Ottowia sp. oral taxon 894 TaxID=1658672 RepID=UPI0006806122|nr:hypothetical protein [Ottowia sp. oral taxon 894]
MAKNQTNRDNTQQTFQNNAQQGDWNQWSAAQQAAAQQAAQQAAYWAAQQGQMPWGQPQQPWGQQPWDAAWAQGAPGYAPGAFPGAYPGAYPGAFPAGAAAQTHGTGWLGWLSNRQMEQFIIGLVLGGAAAYVLGDADKRARLLRMVMKLYAGVAGSVEEFKEQIADLKAEVAAEHGGFADED